MNFTQILFLVLVYIQHAAVNASANEFVLSSSHEGTRMQNRSSFDNIKFVSDISNHCSLKWQLQMTQQFYNANCSDDNMYETMKDLISERRNIFFTIMEDYWLKGLLFSNKFNKTKDFSLIVDKINIYSDLAWKKEIQPTLNDMLKKCIAHEFGEASKEDILNQENGMKNILNAVHNFGVFFWFA